MYRKLAAFCLALAAICCSSVSRADYFIAITNLSVGDNPQGAWLGNLRGDGDSRDLVVANYNANTISVRLFVNNGTFGQENVYPVGSNPAGVHTGDFNLDGLEDIVVANSGANNVSVLLNLGGGANFGAASNYTVGTIPSPVPVSVTVRNVNGDSRQDLIVANSAEDSVSILFGLSGGRFGDATNNYSVGNNPNSVTVANLNTDSFVDILTADKDAGTLTILPGNTNGLFDSPITITLFPGGDPQPVSALAGDFNGDSRVDIAVANYASNTVSILLQDIDGDFSVTSSYDVGNGPKSLLVRDLNRDGILDVAVANSGDDNVQVLFGAGDGTFESIGTFATGDNPSVVVGSNFNEDHATDMAVANANDDNVTILMFNGPLADNVTVTVNEDSLFSDVDLRGRIFDGTTLTNILVDCPSNGDLNTACPTNGLLTDLAYTPDPDFYGTDVFHYQVTDGTLTSLVATVTITVLAVNDEPSFDLSEIEVEVLEDAATTNITDFATNIFQGADNETNQSVFFTCRTTNTGFFSLKPVINSSGRLSFRPTKNVTGTATITVYMKDSGGTLRGGVNTSTTQAFDVVVSPHPLKPFKGTYSGLFYETNVHQPSSGFIQFTMGAYGAFSGKLTGDGGKYPMSGQFDLTGHAHTEVLRNNTTLTLDMDLDLIDDSNQVTGTVTEASWTAQFIGDRALFHAVTNPATQAGKYTMTLPGNENDPVLKPAGDGYATLTVTSAGKIRASGRTADGTSYSQTTYLSQNGQWPFYAPLYTSRGSVLGWITFTNELEYSLEGAGSWIKPAIVSAFYPNGFTNTLAISGSTYTSPPPNTTVLPFTNCVLYLAGGNLSFVLTNADAILNTNNKVYIDTRPVLSLSPSSGLMTGVFADTDLGVTRTLRAVVLQQEGTARGYFRGTNQSGSVLLQED